MARYMGHSRARQEVEAGGHGRESQDGALENSRGQQEMMKEDGRGWLGMAGDSRG